MSLSSGVSSVSWSSRTSTLRDPESPLSRFRRKAQHVRLTPGTQPRISTSRRTVLPSSFQESPNFGSSILSASKKPRESLSQTCSSIEKDLLIKICESKQLRASVDHSQFTPPDISSHKAKLLSTCAASKQGGTKAARSVTRENSSRLFEIQTNNYRHDQARYVLASSLYQPDTQPLEPPVPHRKPEIPSVPTLAGGFLLQEHDMTQTMPVNYTSRQTIESVRLSTANAATRIQRAWRKKRLQFGSPVETPLCVLVVDKVGKSSETRYTEERNKADTVPLPLDVATVDDELCLPAPATDTLSIPAVWSEDEWSFLEEGRAAAEILLNGKGPGARIEDSELVWRFPQKVICKQEADRKAAVRSMRKKKPRTSNVEFDGKPRAGEWRSAPTDSQEATSTKPQPVCRLLHHPKSSRQLRRSIFRRLSRKKHSSQFINRSIPGLSAKIPPSQRDDKEKLLTIPTNDIPHISSPVLRSCKELLDTGTIVSSLEKSISTCKRINKADTTFFTYSNAQNAGRNDLICLGDLGVAGQLLTTLDGVSGDASDNHNYMATELLACSRHLIPLSSLTRVSMERQTAASLNLKDISTLAASQQRPASGYASSIRGCHALPNSGYRGSHGGSRCWDVPSSLEGTCTDNQNLALEDLRRSCCTVGSIDSVNALEELDRRIRRVLGNVEIYNQGEVHSAPHKGLGQAPLAPAALSPAINKSFEGSEQQEFRQILGDFRQFLQLSPSEPARFRSRAPHSDAGSSSSSYDSSTLAEEDNNSDLRLMMSEIRKCRRHVAQALQP